MWSLHLLTLPSTLLFLITLRHIFNPSPEHVEASVLPYIFFSSKHLALLVLLSNIPFQFLAFLSLSIVLIVHVPLFSISLYTFSFQLLNSFYSSTPLYPLSLSIISPHSLHFPLIKVQPIHLSHIHILYFITSPFLTPRFRRFAQYSHFFLLIILMLRYIFFI